jgi:hypothetical protein
VPDATFMQSTAMQRYAKHLDDDLTPDERELRLGLIEQFAKFVDSDPDTMVAEIFDEGTAKYRKRGFYTEAANTFAESLGGSSAQVLFRANVVRSFFIANGRRLTPPRPDWMSG